MNDEQPLKLQQTCLHLRHKLMYVDERQSIPGVVDDSSDTRVFFCMKSQDAIGPDHEPVAPTVCTKGRSCFRRA
jgi:hypothetical protein